MFNTDKNIVKVFITSLIIFLVTIFIPKLNLHANTITTIFDNKNLKNEVAIKAVRARNNLAVFTIELNDKFDNVKSSYMHYAKVNDENNIEWHKRKLHSELGIPLIITNNNENIVILGFDKENQKVNLMIKNIVSFFSENDSILNHKSNSNKYFSVLNSKSNFDLKLSSSSILNLSKQSPFDIKYFWSNSNILNIWTKNDDKVIAIDVNSYDANNPNLSIKSYKLPLNINSNIKKQQITNQLISYNNGIYYAVFNVDNTIPSSNYGISHKIFYSYNGETWAENQFENLFGDYEILLDSFNLGEDLYQVSVNLDFTNYKSTSNTWKITDSLTPWNRMNISIPGESHILSLNKVGQFYNIIIMTPNSSYEQYDIRYFITKDFENFDYNSATPEIAETVNPQYKSLFYLNVLENDSDTSYLEKHYTYKLNDRNQQAINFKFELLKVH